MPMYVQTTREHTTTSTSPTPIPELSLEIPEGSGEQAVIILNTQATAQGAITGGYFALSVDGVTLPQTAAFFPPTSSPPPAKFTIPCTLVAAVPLKLKPQKVQALWHLNPSGSNLSISISSLTALI